MRVICRADVPTAMSDVLGRCAREKRGWAVVRVSTHEPVVRSHVLSVWSQDAE